MEDELDKYLEVFVVANERGEAPVSTQTSGRDLNVPFPVLPGHLGQYTAAPRYAAPSAGLRPAAGAYTAAPRYAAPSMPRAAAPRYVAPSMTPAAQAAGGSLPPPSPAMGASPPPPPDSPAPSRPSMLVATPNYTAAGTSAGSAGAGAGPTGCPTCPPCPSCASAGSGGSLFWLLVAAGAGWYFYSRR